jgi:hypothetical protein
MTPEDSIEDGRDTESRPRVLRTLAAETSIATGNALARIYQSLADFDELTRLLRKAVDEQLGRHIQVTGWQQGELRVHLDRPALATRWRFQEPAARQALSRHPSLRALRHIRLVTTHLGGPSGTAAPPLPSRLGNAPADSFRELAEDEAHPALRAALLRLSDAVRQAKETREGGSERR